MLLRLAVRAGEGKQTSNRAGNEGGAYTAPLPAPASGVRQRSRCACDELDRWHGSGFFVAAFKLIAYSASIS